MLLFCLLFVWCPLFGILVYALYLGHQEEVSVKRLWVLAVMLALYLGCLSVTKERLGDFLEYSRLFQEVPRYNFFSYILLFGKEPVYYGYTYLAYYLFFGNWNLFVFSITTANYLFLSYGLLKIAEHLHTSINNVIVSLFFMAFFFQEFAAIGNMMRQGLAQSITLAFLVRWYWGRKRSWWLALCAVGIHTSCLPILAVGLLPVIQRKMEGRTLIKLSVMVVLAGVFFFFVGGYLAHLPFIGYIFARATDYERLLATDSWQTEVGLQFSMIVLLLLLGGMILFLYRKLESSVSFVIINLNLLLLLMMIVCHIGEMYYLLMRYFFYIYAFQNALFLIFLHENRFFQRRVPQLSMVVLMMSYFYYQFSHNIFSYIPVLEALVYPLPTYLIIEQI